MYRGVVQYSVHNQMEVNKMRKSRITALLLSGALAASMLTGCGDVDQNAVVATLDGEEISLGVANFAARLQQAQYDDFYVAYFGETVWSSDLYGNGTTMEDNIKDSILENVQAMYTLQAHAGEYGVTVSEEDKTAISEAAAAFLDANSKEALKALGATSDIVEEYLTLLTIQSRMYDAIIADADTIVSDEEANTSAYSYVRVSKSTYTDADGNSAAYTAEEQEALAGTFAEFVEEANADTLENVAESYGYTVSNGTFASDTTTLDEAVLTALQSLKSEGEISDVVDTEDYYYVLRLDQITDEEATESHRQSIIEDRQSKLYTEVLTGWEDASEWVVNEKVWATVSFDNLFTTTEPAAETEEVTEEATEAE